MSAKSMRYSTIWRLSREVAGGTVPSAISAMARILSVAAAWLGGWARLLVVVDFLSALPSEAAGIEKPHARGRKDSPS